MTRFFVCTVATIAMLVATTVDAQAFGKRRGILRGGGSCTTSNCSTGGCSTVSQYGSYGSFQQQWQSNTAVITTDGQQIRPTTSTAPTMPDTITINGVTYVKQK